eukprot:2357450-Amphidinium_carterae.1
MAITLSQRLHAYICHSLPWARGMLEHIKACQLTSRVPHVVLKRLMHESRDAKPSSCQRPSDAVPH